MSTVAGVFRREKDRQLCSTWPLPQSLGKASAYSQPAIWGSTPRSRPFPVDGSPLQNRARSQTCSKPHAFGLLLTCTDPLPAHTCAFCEQLELERRPSAIAEGTRGPSPSHLRVWESLWGNSFGVDKFDDTSCCFHVEGSSQHNTWVCTWLGSPLERSSRLHASFRARSLHTYVQCEEALP